MGIEDIRHTHKSKDADLLADSLEANGTRQFLLDNRTQNTRDVVRCDECDKCIEQIVEAAEELTDYDADARCIKTYCQNLIHHQKPPAFFHFPR